jgi:uncharacterized protein YqiB (DUF1249 family)
MGKLRKKFEQKGFDERRISTSFSSLSKRIYPKKVAFIRLYHEKTEIKQISSDVGVHTQTIYEYVNTYISGSS